MRKAKLFFLSIAMACLAIVFPNEQAKACHFGAAEMYAIYIGAGLDGCTGTAEYKYEVHINIYYACQTCLTSGTTTMPISITSATANYTDNATADTIVNGLDTVQSLCPQFFALNSCKDLSNPYNAYQRRKYIGIVTVPSAQPDWVFSTTGCCRNNSNVTGSNFYIECGLNNQIRYNNSTPQFQNDPLPYICVNQPNTYLNGPFDINGDSMDTKQQAPLENATTPCVYTAPYSLADPIGSAASNPYTLNGTTGAATFTPTKPGVYALAFRGEDFDRASGIRTGYCMRDVQVVVVGCNAPPPAIDSLKPSLVVSNGSVVPVVGGSKAIVTCPGNNMNFKINSETKDVTHKLYMYANNYLIPGSAFATVGDGTNSITGSFDWTPAISDIGEHTLIVTSADSSCEVANPIVLKNYTVIYIKVIAGLDAGRDQFTCDLNPPRRLLNVKGYGNLILKVKWSDVSGGAALGIDYDTSVSPTVAGPGGTQYVVYSPDLTGLCKSRDTVLLKPDLSNTVDIFPHTDRYVLCRPGYLQLDAATQGGGPVDNIKCDTLPVTTCPKPDSINIWGSPLFGTDIFFDSIGTSTPKLESEVLTAKFQYLIPKDELREYGLRSGSIKSLSFEIAGNTLPAHEYSNFTISVKCTNKTKLSKVDGFDTDIIPVYVATGNITLENGWHNFVFDKPYNWDTSKNLMFTICYSNNPATSGPCILPAGFPGVFKFMPTTYTAALDIRPGDPAAGITDMCGTSKSGDIKEKATRPIFGLTFCDAPGLPFDYTWYPGTLLSDSTIKAPLTYASKTTNYMVSTLGKNGCRIADTMEVYVPVHDFRVFPDDTSICYGQTTPLEIKKGTYYQWFEYEEGKYLSANNSLSCEYCANPTAKPQKSTRYKIMVGDDVFCYDTIDAYVEVRPLPLVNILTKDTVIKFGQSVQLLVNGGKLYNWSPVSSLNNPNISYPIATPTEPTMYVVSGINSTGCYSYDTVRVGISYRDNLQIPTAFTPNGDGKNDQFRVNNMTFQRFVEFRVFNRWGQEVYQGGDPKSGWDGNWKGVPQEMGNYQYIIRVGSPDGLVETYKGDVTLIR